MVLFETLLQNDSLFSAMAAWPKPIARRRDHQNMEEFPVNNTLYELASQENIGREKMGII